MKLFCVFFALLCGSVYAKSPSELAVKYCNYIEQKNLIEAAKFYHPISLKQYRESIPSFQDKSDDTIKTIFGEKSTASSVMKLSDSDFFAAIMKFKYMGKLKLNFEVIGEVSEGEYITHVTIREKVKFSNVEGVDMAVLSFEKYNEEWKLQIQDSYWKYANYLKHDVMSK